MENAVRIKNPRSIDHINRLKEELLSAEKVNFTDIHKKEFALMKKMDYHSRHLAYQVDR